MAAWWCGGVAMAAAAAARLRGGSGGQLQRSRQHWRQGDDALASVTEAKQVAGWQGCTPARGRPTSQHVHDTVRATRAAIGAGAEAPMSPAGKSATCAGRLPSSRGPCRREERHEASHWVPTGTEFGHAKGPCDAPADPRLRGQDDPRRPGVTPEPCRHCREAESAHRPTHARGMAATALSTPTEYDLRHEEARKVERMRCLVAGDRCYDNKDGVQVRGWRARVDGQVSGLAVQASTEAGSAASCGCPWR